MSNQTLDFYHRKGKLVHTGLSEDEICRVSFRASHLVVCEICNKQYIDHPYIDDVLDSVERPFLHQVCNGDIVKL